MFASVKRVTDVSKPQIFNPQVPTSGGGMSNQVKLARAKQLAAKINIAKKIGGDNQDITQQAAKAIFVGDTMVPQVAVSIAQRTTINCLIFVGYQFSLFSWRVQSINFRTHEIF